MRLSDIVRTGARALPPREVGRAPRPASSPAPEPVRPVAPVRELRPPAPPDRVERLHPSEPTEGGAPKRGDAADLIFQRAVERIRETLAVRREAPFSLAQAEEAVEILLKSLESSDALLASFFRVSDLATNPARKAVNVAILAMKMGLELGYPRKEVRDLGLAALLCDVGTTLVPAEILGSPGALTANDRAILRSRQLEAAQVLPALTPEYRWLGEVIRARYEKPDGPHQPQDRLEECAAIIHLAEMYKSLVHPRPSRKRLGPLDALKEILSRHRATFPDKILKALIRSMSTYPVGSLVRLNTDDIAQVSGRNKDYPLRPVVEIIVRRGRRLPEPVRLDLAQSPLIHIKESVLEDALP
ncbi:MAG TPA: HD domain-containing phosphohydrolase [Methylomirabilota bacterium]|nr:HD domain-containing phosphohydrolase [Methylomirabilota bacterium]